MRTAIAAIFASVGFAMAQDPAPETKALISRLVDESKSKSVSVRVSAFKSMGELRDRGASVRRRVVEGMLDPDVKVRREAADALAKIDPAMHKLAISIQLERSQQALAAARNRGEESDPLIPLIRVMASSYVPELSKGLPDSRQIARKNLVACIESLAIIGKSDPVVSDTIMSLLANSTKDSELCGVAMQNVVKLKSKRLAAPTIFAIAEGKRPGPQMLAVKLLPEIVDENNVERAQKLCASLRFDPSPTVRATADQTLVELEAFKIRAK
jgi:hypothetical protein